MSRYLFFASILISLSFCLSVRSVEVKSDLTENEESELAIDESVTKAESKRLDIMTEKISLLIRANELDDAIAVFQKLAATYEDKDNLTTNRIEKAGFTIAGAILKAGNYEKTSKFADDLQKLTKDDAIVFYIKALAYEGLGKIEDAAKWKEKAVAFNADDAKYRVEIGQFFFDQKNLAIAEAEFRKVLEISAKEGDKSEEWLNAQLFLGRIADERMAYEESAKYYDELIKTLVQENQFDQQSRELRAMMIRGMVAAHLNAAREYEIKGEYEKEFEMIQLAMKYYPTGSPGLMNAAAAALSRLKKYDEAKAIYERLIKEEPLYPDTLVGYGDVLLSLGQKDDAEAQFKKAIELFKKIIDDAGADKEDIASNLNNLAWFYAMHKRDIEEGIKLAKRSLELRPGEEATMDTLAELLFLNGQKDEAIKYIKQAIDKKPPHLLYYQKQLEKFEGKTPENPDKPK
jgi:tetratricopeptide (TPR) repeat protein